MIGDFHMFSQDDNLVFSIAFYPQNRLRAGEELPWPESLKLKVNVATRQSCETTSNSIVWQEAASCRTFSDSGRHRL